MRGRVRIERKPETDLARAVPMSRQASGSIDPSPPKKRRAIRAPENEAQAPLPLQGFHLSSNTHVPDVGLWHGGRYRRVAGLMPNQRIDALRDDDHRAPEARHLPEDQKRPWIRRVRPTSKASDWLKFYPFPCALVISSERSLNPAGVRLGVGGRGKTHFSAAPKNAHRFSTIAMDRSILRRKTAR